MPRESKHFILDRCPVCQNPKPCALHDQELKEAILNPEEEEPGFEKMAEWDYGMPIQQMARFSDTEVLVGGKGGKIKQVDLSEPHPELKTLIDIVPHGNRCSILKITPVSESLFVVKFKMDGVDRQWVIDHEGKKRNDIDDRFFIIKDTKNQPMLMKKSDSLYYEFYDFTESSKKISSCAFDGNLVAEHPIFLPNHELFLITKSHPRDVYDRILFGHIYHFPPDFSGDRMVSHLVLKKMIYFSNNAVDLRSGSFYPLSTTTILFESARREELGLLNLAATTVNEKYDEQKHTFESTITAVSKLSEIQFVVGHCDGSVYHCDISNPSHWSIKKLTQLGDSISAIETIGDAKIFIASGNQCEYWGIDQNKLRAYHERQIAAEDQELPELPEI